MTTVRQPAVAGLFYPADPRELAHDVRALLAEARLRNTEDHTLPSSQLDPSPPWVGYGVREGASVSLRESHIKALIAPHAGYIYSGAVAASAYATLEPIANRVRRVVLLGPTHRVAVRGLALPGVDAFDTPLGRVEMDAEAVRSITTLPQVRVSSEAHAQEHSLEVHLPFLQTMLPDFKLLPLAVGMATTDEVAEVLEALWGGDETLIVISSDLSHFLPYVTAQRVDNATVRSILDLNQPPDHEQACGATPIGGLLVAARRHHLTPHLLDLRNSGDTAGSHDRVVGYASIAFTEGA